jgi:hypothetical protein
MPNQNEVSDEDKRREYVPPEATKVLLRSQEAVLGGCKMATGGGVGAEDFCATCATVQS